MAISDSEVAKLIIRVVNKQVTDAYARQSVNKLPERYEVRETELQDAYREAYKHIWNQAVKNKDPKWPDPAGKFKHVLEAGFKAAGSAAYNWINKSLDHSSTKRTLRAEGTGKAPIVFLQPQGMHKPFHSKMKTAGLRELNEHLKNAGLSEIRFYEDLKKAGEDNARNRADDMLFRRLLHREHLGITTTGMAALSIRSQVLDKIAPDFYKILSSKPEKDLASLLGDITTSFVPTASRGLAKLKAKKGVEMNLRLGSFIWNLSGDRAGDLVSITKLFNEWAEKALEKALKGTKILNQLKNVKDIKDAELIIGNKLAKKLAGQAGKATQNRIAARKGGKVEGETIKPKPHSSNKHTIGKAPVSEWDVYVDKKEEISHLLKIRSILNAFINKYVQDNMGQEGRLVYRTGRFASTIYVEDVKRNPGRGTLSTKFRYMEYPYRVFEGQGPRDPRTLIEFSIREILKEQVVSQLKESSNINAMTTRRGAAFPYFDKKDWAKGI